MTSINNYESVVLPETPQKEKKSIFGFIKDIKDKKFDFRIKKKHIAVTSMVLMLSAAVYINYLYAAGDIEDFVETGKNYGDSILVEGSAEEEITDTAAFFSEARISRQQSRDDAVATIENLYVSAENEEEQVSVLAEKASQIVSNMELETKIESIIKAKGFSDCIVYISGEYADVMVETEGLLPTEAAVSSKNFFHPGPSLSPIQVSKACQAF